MQPTEVNSQEEQALRHYRRLAEQLENQQISPSQAAVSARQITTRLPSILAVERLQAEAKEQYWYAPRYSWVLAHVAHAATLVLAESESLPHPALLLADSSLILGITFNTLGRFAEAVPLLQAAAERFHAHDKLALAVRASSEMALACTYLGEFKVTQVAIANASKWLAGLDDSFAHAYYNWAQGWFYLKQNYYDKAVISLRKAGDGFLAVGYEGEAALALCHLTEVLRYIDVQKALKSIKIARHVSIPKDSAVHMARCDYILALIYEELNQYAQSLDLYRQTRKIFAEEGMHFMAACCDLEQGVVHYRLNQYKEALQAYHQARTYFVSQAYSSYMAMCDLNIAVVYYDINRYAEALELYQSVAEMALTEGRVLRAAHCHTNMGLCYDKLGRYDQALLLHDRARQAFARAGSSVYVAGCQENLAGTYHALGRHKQALAHYQQARETFSKENRLVYTAYCDSQLADLYLAMGQSEEAYRCLEEAKRIYQKEGLPVNQAACHRLLAQVAYNQGQYDLALTHLQQARSVFASQEMIVEVAVCDLIEGEVKIAGGKIQSAEELFRRAQAVLVPGFPDLAWRAEEGLGRCALAKGEEQAALNCYTAAANFIGQARDTLPTERLNSTFFARRQHVLQSAIKLALELGEIEQALVLVESSKARTLLTQYRSQQLRIDEIDETDDSYLAHLVEREAALRQELEALRSQLTSWERYDSPLPYEKITRGNQAIALKELAELSQRYEEVVDQLRLSTSMVPSVPALQFSVAAFREAARVHLSGNWNCLTFFLADDQLIIFSLDAQSLKVHTKQLTSHDHRILLQCVSSTHERRELVYRGTIRGFPVPGHPGRGYRQHLGQLLLPPEVLAVKRDVLILVPHGILHGLPFHTLFIGHTLLLEQVPVLYAPSLQVLQALWSNREHPEMAKTDKAQVTSIIESSSLVYGVETFDGRAYPLPHVSREVEAVANTIRDKVQVLYSAKATVSSLKQMSMSGKLAKFEIVHFATHAITEAMAPMLSRVLLADDDLTVVDILDLKMEARLVTLSSCQAAVSEAKAGDEMMTLARAFFYAGAQTVVASLWAVEDKATAVLMQYFYQRLQAGESIPQALRQTQLAMHPAGYSAYQWAP